MRKKTFYAIQVITILLVISLRAFGQNDPSVKIIHFGVGNADCVLIVIKDFDKSSPPVLRTVTILIDTGIGNSKYNNMGSATYLWGEIWKRIQAEQANQLDFLVISHLDGDHVGNAKEFLRIIKVIRNNYTWKDDLVIIDRLAFDKTSGDPNATVKQYRFWDLPVTNKTAINRYQAEYMNKYSRNRKPDPANPTKKFNPQRSLLFFGQDLLKLKYKLENTQMICLASNGVIGAKREAVAVGDDATSTQPKGENDLSFAFLLRFGSFRYYTGGDIDDNPDETKMEEPLVKRMDDDWKVTHQHRTPIPKFHACAIKVNHHGSENGTQARFVEVFNPKVAVYSAGLKPFGKKKPKKIHPSQEVITRLAADEPICGVNPKPSRLQLFTFRIKSGIKSDADPMEKLSTSKNWKNMGLQDVILYVQKENDGSPLNGKPPKIYMFRMWRMKGTYAPQSPTIRLPIIPTGQPMPKFKEEFAYEPTVIACDRVDDCTNKTHNALPLPEKDPPISAKQQLQLLTQLRLLFNQQ